MKRYLLVLLLSLAVLGCNKGKRVLEEATRLAAEGELDGALSQLETLKEVAPGTEEEAEGQRLAVEWLMSEATSKAITPEGALQKVRTARSWQAENPQAAELECRLLHKLDRPDDFLACFKGLPGSVGEGGRKELQGFADGIRRARLRKSDNLKDWLALIQEFPASDEAQEVRETIAERHSLCGMKERKDALDRLVFATDYLTSTWNDWVKKAFDQGSAFSRNAKLEEGVTRTTRAAELAAERHAASKGKISEQPAFLNEDKVRADLLALYSALEVTANRWLRLRMVNYVHQIAPTVRSIEALQKADAENVEKIHVRVTEACWDLISKTDWSLEVARALGEPAPTAEGLPPMLSSWLSAQNSGDFEAYAKLYAADFQGTKNFSGEKKQFGRQEWLNNRKGMFATTFSVDAADLKVEEKDGAQVLTFTQTWKSPSSEDQGTKVLHIRDGKIVREEQLTSAPILPGPSETEWAAAKEITVQGSTALGCETKVLGGFFRAVCGENSAGKPTGGSFVGTVPANAVARSDQGKMILLHPYKPGTEFSATLTWERKSHRLGVRWPTGTPQPGLVGTFDEAPSTVKANKPIVSKDPTEQCLDECLEETGGTHFGQCQRNCEDD